MIGNNKHAAQPYTFLENVFEDGAYSNIALNQELKQSTLSPKDKALVTEIVYGTVARKITLEWYLAHYIKDRDELEPWVYDLLMLSLYQLLYLDKMPAHAVVNDAVTIAKKRSHQKVRRNWSMLFCVALLKKNCPNQQILSEKTNAIRCNILYPCGQLKAN